MGMVAFRTILARSLYILPFILGIFFLDNPYNVLALCLLVIKSKFEPDYQRFETTVFLDYISRNMNKSSDTESNSELKTMKELFLQPDIYIENEKIPESNTLIYLEMIHGLVEGTIIIIGLIYVSAPFVSKFL